MIAGLWDEVADFVDCPTCVVKQAISTRVDSAKGDINAQVDQLGARAGRAAAAEAAAAIDAKVREIAIGGAVVAGLGFVAWLVFFRKG